MEFKRLRYEEDIVTFGSAPKNDDFWEHEYNLYNRISPDNEGVSFDDICKMLPVWAKQMMIAFEGKKYY